MIQGPEGVYINWSAYDELSDNVQLTEELAMRQLGELLRLRKQGGRLDYYLMDCFWYAPASGYREWRKPHWPAGPDRWLGKCLENGVKPGLWVATNNCGAFAGLAPHPAWKDSLTEGNWACCMFAGGFLQHFMESLHLWYERGVRMYKFDFCALQAATPAIARTMLPSEIRQANVSALSAALKSFRVSHPEVRLIAYNGFDECPSGPGHHMSNTSVRPTKVMDTRWLEVFDSVYCGDPRPADVPAMNFWRSKDVYSDHMVRLFEMNGYPLSRVDSSGFMIGTTGTCYYRGKAAWKGMLLLSLARGGWVNTYYGNLELLSDEDGRWFAKAQDLFWDLQQFGKIATFGAMPGMGEPYGFVAEGAGGSVITVVNPGQKVATVAIPEGGRVLCCDAGFRPVVSGGAVTLGPEQMAMIGVGCYADERWELGVQEDVVIPLAMEKLAMNEAGEVNVPDGKGLRIIFRQQERSGMARRSSGGAAPKGKPMGQLFTIEARQGGKTLPLRIEYDKQVWSGLSWAAAECAAGDLKEGAVQIRCSSSDLGAATLIVEAYAVSW